MKNITTSTDIYGYTDYDDTAYDSEVPDEDAAPCSLGETWEFLGRFAPIAYILVFILALVGNILVLCVIRRYRQSRHSPCSFSLTDTFLLHLAVSDLLLAVTLPFFAVEWINEWVFGVFMCKVAGAVFSLNVYCGVLFLACISFDRYLAIVHAINISWRRKTCHAQLACATIWVVCLGLALVDVYHRDMVEIKGMNRWVCHLVYSQENFEQWQIGMQLVSLILGFILPLLVMLYCYLRIFKALCHATRRQKRRSLRLIISLVIVFVVSWAPYNALRLTDSLQTLKVIGTSCAQNKVLDVGILVTESLGLAHCALNPLLYGLVGIKFRRELAQMCKSVLGPQGCLGLAGWANGRGSTTRRPNGSFSSVESENTSYFSVMAFDYDDYEYKEVFCPSSTVSGGLAVFIPLLYSVGFLWGLLGNGLLLAILWRKRNSSVMDIFILHLSVSDSLLLLTLPLWAVDAVKGWIMGIELCKLSGALFKINFYCGIFTLACISVDCYLSSVHGVQMFSSKRLVVVYGSCLIIWILCLLLSIPDWIFLKSISGRTGHGKGECIHFYPPDSWRVASRFPHLVCFVLLLLFCCFSILLKRWHDSKCEQKKKGQSTAIIAALVLAFFISWTPYNITFMVNTAQPVDSVSSAGTDECEGRQWTASKITAIFGLLHCIVNPVIYLCLSKEFRRRAMNMIKFRACKTESNDVSLWDSSGVNGNASVQEEQGSLQPMNNINQQ